jgi:hypothetical protein
MFRVWKGVAVSTTIVLLGAAASWAPVGSGVLTGIVKDSNGGTIPGDQARIIKLIPRERLDPVALPAIGPNEASDQAFPLFNEPG